ncbi:hypothetical protein Dimus_012709 [Dionaea muscipula]
MASGILGAEETRERYHWNGSCKVYTRKFKNKQSSAAATRSTLTHSSSSIVSNGSVYNAAAAAAKSNNGNVTTASNGDVAMSCNGNGITSNDGDASTVDNGETALVNNDDTTFTNTGDTATTNDGDNAAMVDNGDNSFAKNGDTGTVDDISVPQNYSKAPPVEDRNSLQLELQSSLSPQQPQEDLSSQLQQIQEPLSPPRQLQEHVLPPHELPEDVSRLELGSDDLSSSDRMETGVPDMFVGTKQNGSVMPIATRRVNINFAVARSSKKEARVLKRKLTGELDEVRNLVKMLEEKEVQIGNNGVAGAGMAGVVSGNGVALGGSSHYSQYPTDHHCIEKGGDIRLNGDASLVGISNRRTYRQLTVSVMDDNRHDAVGGILEKGKRTPKANPIFCNSDFIFGKAKLPLPPTAESNKKKLKSAASKKPGGREMKNYIMKRCGNLLLKLMKHKHGWVFNKPVDVKGLGLHDYYDIIKHPMDLGTVKTRLSKNWYKSAGEFAEDVRLTFHNAMTYNPKGQDVHTMAEELLNIFEENWVDIEAEYNDRHGFEMVDDVGLPSSHASSRKFSLPLPPPYLQMHAAVSAPTAPLLHHPPPVLERSESMMALPPKPIYNASVGGRTPALKKPKAKDPNKRNMTFEEKQRLSANLQGLPSEKLDGIIQIIKKRNPALSLQDDEIEVDIDSVDAETLWELDRFVTNYKKSLSKYKRKAELALQRAEAAQALQKVNPMAQRVEARKEARGETDENNATASSPVHGDMQPVNGSGSSSSSSDSGSSSSDSDSNSSSESGS